MSKQVGKEEKSTEQFIKLPFKYMTLRTKEIGTNELVLLSLIGNLSQKFPCTATNSKLAEYMNKSDRTIRRYLEKLIHAGLLLSEPNPIVKSNRTLLINHSKIDAMLQKCEQVCSTTTDKLDKFDHVGGQNSPTEMDSFDHVTGQLSPTKVDSFDFENPFNPNEINDFQSLIDNSIENIIDKKIDNITSADAEVGANAPIKPSIIQEMENEDFHYVGGDSLRKTTEEAVNYYLNEFKEFINEDDDMEEIKKSMAIIIERKRKEYDSIEI
jgi:hypothetical protein